MANQRIPAESISFSKGRTALVLRPGENETVQDIAASLALPAYHAVILFIGGANNIEPAVVPLLTQLVSRGIARAAIEVNAVILDGGTRAGVMEMMGQGVADCGHKTPLIGVAPGARVQAPAGTGGADGVPADPNHSHLVCVEGQEWGDETATLLDLTNSLASQSFQQPGTNVAIPALVILAAGGRIARNEVILAVRQKLPIIIIQGSGGQADEIAAAWLKKDKLPADPILAEIIDDGDIRLHELTDPVRGMIRLIARELGEDKVLVQVWETFASYDQAAGMQRKKSDVLQLSVIILGVAGTLLAIIQEVTHADDNEFPGNLLKYILIIIPILLTLLMTISNRFKQANKWLLLRSAAEAIKREIYRYRTRARDYQTNAQQVLTQRVEDITRRTMTTEVNTSSIRPYDRRKGFPPDMHVMVKGKDDGFSLLTPEQYVEIRLSNQLDFFSGKTVALEFQLKWMSWVIILIGGLGTFLAAVGQPLWIALTTVMATAFTTYLGYRQTESTLKKYNQAATDLYNIRGWWNALTAEEQSLQVNIDLLVEHSEQVLKSELDGWVQQMQNALVELRKKQESAGDSKGAAGKDPG